MAVIHRRRGNVIKVLLADDSHFIYEIVRELLEDSIFVLARTANTGEECIRMYKEIQPDIVLLDIIMPGIDGIDTLKLLKAEHPEAKGLICSSLAYDDTVETAKEAGADGVIFKPYTKEIFLPELQKVIQ